MSTPSVPSEASSSASVVTSVTPVVPIQQLQALRALKRGFDLLGAYSDGWTTGKVMDCGKTLPKNTMFEIFNTSSDDPAYVAWKVAHTIDAQFPKQDFRSGIIPSKFQDVVHSFTWAIPDPRTINAILSRSKRIIDLGAGTGYLAMRLAQHGATEVIAVDDNSDDHEGDTVSPFHPIIQHEAVAWSQSNRDRLEHGKGCSLLFAWPRSTKMMERCVELFDHAEFVFVIGKSSSSDMPGDEGTGSLEQWMRAHDKQWIVEQSILVPNWRYDVHTSLFIFRRRSLNNNDSAPTTQQPKSTVSA